MYKPEDFIKNPEKIRRLKKQHYALFGHSAVKLCHYTKHSLRKNKFCYKFHFYGIKSHQCIQMTPTSNFCNQECNFCWRTLGWDENNWEKIDTPKEIVTESIKKQRLLLTGFGGIKEPGKINTQLYEASQEPKHVAISLTGEPTLYPLLTDLIEEYHKNHISTFLVTNGTRPKVIQKMIDEDKLPTQLYVSIDAYNEEMHKKTNSPKEKGTWEKINKTLELFNGINTRTCIRVTCVNGQNMQNPKEYAKILLKAKPWFVELKAYMYVGFSRLRLQEENMPTIDMVMKFAKEVAKEMNYDLRDSVADSRVVLLVRKDITSEKQKINFKEFFEEYDKKRS